MNRTIARLAQIVAVLAALVALVPAAASAATAPAPEIRGLRTWISPERSSGDSVAVTPGRIAWFGILGSFSLARVRSGKLEVESLAPSRSLEDSYKMGSTESVRLAANGSLWFLRSHEGKQALLRRAPGGKLRGFKLPGTLWVRSVAPGLEGDVWFTRGFREATRIGVMTSSGAVTEHPLAAGSGPASIVAGPDGDFWFTEELAGMIGRISPRGEIQLFTVGPNTRPSRIVAGSDGALWFTENRTIGTGEATIGRITTEGAVSEFTVPFGGRIVDLAPDPRRVIWFTTAAGEISSISPSGEIGPRGCMGDCSTPIEKIALGPDGTIWFTAGKSPWDCSGCGGEATELAANRGSAVGRIPAGALEPAGGGEA